MIAVEQYKFTERQSQLTKNQLAKTQVTIKEVEGSKPDQVMYRSLGRLFLNCGKDQILRELGENKELLEKEQNNYAELSKQYKEK